MKLDGEVGVLGNGAGLTMSTVDVVTFAGGRPANFCDLGGGGDAEGVVDALEVITRDPQVKSTSSTSSGHHPLRRGRAGILQALEQIELPHPIVVRLDGTNAEEGRRILAEAAPDNLHVEPTMLDAARRAWSCSGVTGRLVRPRGLVRRVRRAPRGCRSRPGSHLGGGRGGTALDVATGGGTWPDDCARPDCAWSRAIRRREWAPT